MFNRFADDAFRGVVKMLCDKLVEYLKNNHTDISECISARKLCLKFGVSSIEIRKVVNEARSEGVPICSCDKGYFYSELPSDILKTVNSLTGRIAKMQTAINGLTLKAYGSMES
jgi:biotin operon repressor